VLKNENESIAPREGENVILGGNDNIPEAFGRYEERCPSELLSLPSVRATKGKPKAGRDKAETRAVETLSRFKRALERGLRGGCRASLRLAVIKLSRVLVSLTNRKASIFFSLQTL